jgi:hypothetical protein
MRGFKNDDATQRFAARMMSYALPFLRDLAKISGRWAPWSLSPQGPHRVQRRARRMCRIRCREPEQNQTTRPPNG